MQRAKVIKGPHLLFTGANGYKAWGITLESLYPELGYQKVWQLNANTLKKLRKDEWTAEYWGITLEELDKLADDCINKELNDNS